MTEGAALAALLGDADGQRFADEIWARSSWSRKAGEGSDLTGLLTLDDVDELLANRAVRTPFLRIAKDGVVVDPALYTGGTGVGARVRDQIDGDRLVQLLADGCTVVLQGLHRTWAPLRSFSGALTTELGHPVQVNAYLTPEGARGFDPHYDTHDVFVVQTAGAKEWRVHAPVVALPRPEDEWSRHRERVAVAAAGEPVLVRTLEPGDVIYLPRGWIHAARANAGLSLHLTFGIHPYTRRALADALVAEALSASVVGGDPLDASLPLGVDLAGAAGLDAAIDDVREALVERLRALDSGAIPTALGRRWAADTRPAPVRPVQQLLAADDMAEGTLFRARAGLALRVEVTGRTATLSSGGRALAFDVEHASTLHRIATGTDFRADEVTSPGSEASRQVLRDVVLSGLVVVVGTSR